MVEGVNRVKRHMKPTPRMPEGGIVEKDRPDPRLERGAGGPQDREGNPRALPGRADGKKSPRRSEERQRDR